MNDTRPLHERRFVRVRETRGGFVEFDFSIGDPMLSVELILPEAAFAEFCVTNAVQTLDAETAIALDAEKRTWRDGESDLIKKAGGSNADRHQDQ